jgi:hypothetical protein
VNTGVLKMQAQRKIASGDESNCLLLIFQQILNFLVHLYNSRVCEIIVKTQEVQRVLNIFQVIKSG